MKDFATISIEGQDGILYETQIFNFTQDDYGLIREFNKGLNGTSEDKRINHITWCQKCRNEICKRCSSQNSELKFVFPLEKMGYSEEKKTEKPRRLGREVWEREENYLGEVYSNALQTIWKRILHEKAEKNSGMLYLVDKEVEKAVSFPFVASTLYPDLELFRLPDAMRKVREVYYLPKIFIPAPDCVMCPLFLAGTYGELLRYSNPEADVLGEFLGSGPLLADYLVSNRVSCVIEWVAGCGAALLIDEEEKMLPLRVLSSNCSSECGFWYLCKLTDHVSEISLGLEEIKELRNSFIEVVSFFKESPCPSERELVELSKKYAKLRQIFNRMYFAQRKIKGKEVKEEVYGKLLFLT